MNPSRILKVVSTQGPRWASTRLKAEAKKRSRILVWKTPLQSWSDLSLTDVLKRGIPSDRDSYSAWRMKNCPRFFFRELSAVRGNVGEGSIELANQILKGRFPLFSREFTLGFPPAWQQHPITGESGPAGHWSYIDAFKHGDIKFFWEPSRFTWAFTLARAYARNGEEGYPEAFWQLFASWLGENPPNWGINWMCGQETALRAMALCFAAYAFSGSVASTPERMASLVTALSIHAKRIAAFPEYARSQKNNHSISEGAGMWTIGLLFPEMEGSADWKALGRKVVETEVRRQIYGDGSYVQHSINYHRLMLQDLAWALRLGELHEERFPPDVYDRFKKSVRFLYALTDSHSGFAPNYGANDGALVLPLSDCSYPDMRPVLQACYFLTEQSDIYPAGPWDEEKIWLNGNKSDRSHQTTGVIPLSDLCSEAGGYYTLHSRDSWLMVRGAKYRDRPSHADQLHVDMWWRGENVLCDPGTYSYNAPEPFDHGFASTRYHNCLTVDDADQMTKVGRFLWADWATSSVQRHEYLARGLKVLEGEHDGYRKKKVRHRRAIAEIDANIWIIVDDLSGLGEHKLCLHWLTQDVPFEVVSPNALECTFRAGKMRIYLSSNADGHFDIVRCGRRIFGEINGSPNPSRGWQSRYYGCKEPAISIGLESKTSLPVRFLTLVVLGSETPVEVSSHLQKISIGGSQITLSKPGDSTINVRKN